MKEQDAAFPQLAPRPEPHSAACLHGGTPCPGGGAAGAPLNLCTPAHLQRPQKSQGKPQPGARMQITEKGSPHHRENPTTPPKTHAGSLRQQLHHAQTRLKWRALQRHSLVLLR